MNLYRIKRYGEVFTPPKTVNEMLDMLEREDPNCFLPEKTFLEPTCGEGVFIVEILKRKFDRCQSTKDYDTALESIYGIDILKDNVEKTIKNVIDLCWEYFVPSEKNMEVIENHIIQGDSLKIMRMMSKKGVKV